jgi:hypothetical protein
MTTNITVKFLDKSDLIIAEETVVDDQDMPAPLIQKAVLAKIMRKNVHLDWDKIFIFIEKV